jgi:hypothetical protein
MLHVSDLSYGTINAGLFDGKGALCLEFGHPFDLPAADLLLTIQHFLSKHSLQTTHIRLLGDLYHQPAEDLDALLSTLVERGFSTSAIVDGKQKPSWLDRVAYRIAAIDDDPWLGFNAAEVRYVPTKAVPVRPEVLPRECPFLYIVGGKNTAPQDLLSFSLQNPDFRIFSAPLRSYRMKIPIEIGG